MKIIYIILYAILLPLSLIAQHNDNCVKQAALYIDNYKYQKALDVLQHCNVTDSSNLELLKQKALCYQKLGQPDKAKKLYIEILTQIPENIIILNRLANSYVKENNYRQAISYYQKLLQIDSLNSYYYKQIAYLYSKKSQTDSAVYFYTQTLKYNPYDMDVIVNLSKILLKQHQYAEADSFIVDALQKAPENNNLLLIYSKLLFLQERYDNSIQVCNQIIELTADTTLPIKKIMAFSYFNMKQYEKSLPFLIELAQQEKDKERFFYYAGVAARNLKDYENSVYYLKKAIEEGISKNLSNYYMNLAISFEEKGNHKEAIKAYKLAYNTSKDNTLLYHLARNYDAYYKNKKTALMYYEIYLSQNDTQNIDYQNYSKHRISEIKKTLHFELDTIE